MPSPLLDYECRLSFSAERYSLLFEIEVFPFVESSFICLQANHNAVRACNLSNLCRFVDVGSQDCELGFGVTYDTAHDLTRMYANADAPFPSIF